MSQSQTAQTKKTSIFLSQQEERVRNKIIKLKSEDTPFTANSLSDCVSNTIKSRTVEDAFKEYIQLFNDEN